MKKIFILTVLSVLLTGCGVGSYTISSGSPDSGFICVVDDDAHDVVVKVDGKDYNVKTIKTKAYKSGRDIKNTTLNSVVVASGQHEVEVIENGRSVLSKKILVSAGETKILEL